MFFLVAATAGFGGGNFASSMANINFFYPAPKKGAALGLNAAGGNIGVALIQFFLPMVVGGAGAFGLVEAAEAPSTCNVPAICTPAWLIAASVGRTSSWTTWAPRDSKPREQLGVLKHKQTWVMSFLYIGTFGSFIGYSAAMPLLIKINFWSQPLRRPASASISPSTRSSAPSSAPSPGRSAAGCPTGSAAPG